MAIFGIFGKKDGQSALAGKDIVRSEGGLRPNVASAAARTPQRNAERASATARKIDAIESEMSSEFGPAHAANSTLPNPPAAPSRPAFPSSEKNKPAAQLPRTFEATLPIMDGPTDFLLGEEGQSISVEAARSEDAQVYEEAAILFANGQMELTEQILRSAIEEEKNSRGSPRTAWWMLFDLYQITGQQQPFESLAIDYARKFETSPPTFNDMNNPALRAGVPSRPGARPTVSFSGKLDGSISKILERAIKQSENSSVLRLEFSKVTTVDPVGCGLLLRLFKRLQKTGHELILVGADQLAGKVQAILQVGRRDETEAPWLLLLEVLRLLNKEQEFEEASIDYCITFEVSPPSFVAPANKVSTAAEESAVVGDTGLDDRLMMPALIGGAAEQVLAAINQFAATQQKNIVLDCSRLSRVDFTAAGELLIGLAPLAGQGKTIELQQVNHLVAVLFNVMGLKDIVTIHSRKY